MLSADISPSHINPELREAHGYGAWSYFDYRRSEGPFAAASGVRTDVTGPSVSEILKELDRIRSAPLSDEELKLAKDAVIRSLPGRFETSSGTVNAYSAIHVYRPRPGFAISGGGPDAAREL